MSTWIVVDDEGCISRYGSRTAAEADIKRRGEGRIVQHDDVIEEYAPGRLLAHELPQL